MHKNLMERIAGDIVLAKEPSKAIRKWRKEFGISQNELAGEMKIRQSVISDYESGRRKSPGANAIRRMVYALIAVDGRKGGLKTRELGWPEIPDGVLASDELRQGVAASKLMKIIQAKNMTPEVSILREVYGYTVIDSLTAITSLTFQDYYKIYGSTSARVLVFTNVKRGRSPMIAVRIHPLKPVMVVYVRPDDVDPLAMRLAEIDNVILSTTDLKVSEVIERLEQLR
jgi:putative transcriptional regulator